MEPISRPLKVLAEVHLTAQQIDRLRLIEKYDLWFVIERITEKGTVPSHLIDQAITEFRKYIALIAMGYENLGMHSPEIDEVWHGFILFTRRYSEFCNSVCGRMIHHTPNTSRRPDLPMPSVPTFREAYEKFFGSIPGIWQRTGSANAEATAIPGNNRDSTSGECDSQDESPEFAIVAGDCDVVDAPPCKSSIVNDCDADGMDDGCRAEIPTAPSLPIGRNWV
jgi:hypothetical protein